MRRSPIFSANNNQIISNNSADKQVLENNAALSKLVKEFNIDSSVVLSLKSPELVYKRLARIISSRTNLENSELTTNPVKDLYRAYCADGKIDEDFLFLLDDNKEWFRNYFVPPERDALFCQGIMQHACATGNDVLVNFLVSQKNCFLTQEHVEAAARSGEGTVAINALNTYLSKNSLDSPDDVKHNVRGGERYFLSKVFSRAFAANNTTFIDHYFDSKNRYKSTDHAKQLDIVHFETYLSKSRPNIAPIDPLEELVISGSDTDLQQLSHELKTLETSEISNKDALLAIKASNLLSTAIAVNSVKSVKFLLDNFRHLLRNSNKEYFFSKSVKSGNVELVTYITKEFAYTPTSIDFDTTCRFVTNLRMIDWFLDRGCELIPDCTVESLYEGRTENTLRASHYLATKHSILFPKKALNALIKKSSRSTLPRSRDEQARCHFMVKYLIRKYYPEHNSDQLPLKEKFSIIWYQTTGNDVAKAFALLDDYVGNDSAVSKVFSFLLPISRNHIADVEAICENRQRFETLEALLKELYKIPVSEKAGHVSTIIWFIEQKMNVSVANNNQNIGEITHNSPLAKK